MGCAEEPSKLPALQTGQPGLQGPDEARAGWRGEEWAGSETIARFPDHRLLPSDKLRSSEETRKKDWKKFRGEESQPNRELWTAWSYCPSQAREREHAYHVHTRSQAAHSHSCIHTRGLVHTHTHRCTIRSTALYSLQRAFSFIFSLDTEGWRDCP